MFSKESINDVNEFLNLHILTQLKCMQLSKELNKHGFPGFAWFYQIQSMDEVMHQRRIINFLQDTLGAENYLIQSPPFEPFAIKNLEEAISCYIKMREETLKIATDLKAHANKRGDWLTSDFYNWFIKDYWTEISENNDILDRVKMSPTHLAGLDRRAGKREEINPDDVIHPMRHFLIDGLEK